MYAGTFTVPRTFNKVAYGQSEETYRNDTTKPPMQGVYQGNRAGPIIWAVVSSPLLQILKEDGFGTFFQMAISNQMIQIVGYAFVDDTDLIQTARNGQQFAEVNIEMQKAMNLREGLIKNTGGALATDNADGGVLISRGMMDDGDIKPKRN